MGGDSENLKAFRNRLTGLVQQHAADARVVEQTSRDIAAKADKSAAETTEKGQKLLERVRERAANLRKEEEKSGPQEIGSGIEDPDAEDVDPEVERFSQQLVGQEKERAAAAGPAATNPAAAAGPASVGPAAPEVPQPPPEWQVRAGRFGQPSAPPAPPVPPGPPVPPAQPAPEPANGWNVQAGRFGRKDKPKAAPEPPPEPPARPAPPPSPPRPQRSRQPVDDDDEDFENQTWLR